MVEAVHRFPFEAMASRCEIRLAAPDTGMAEELAQAAIAEVRRIERTYSRYRSDSVVSRINAAAGAAPVAVDAETRSLLDFAGRLHELSGGLFDITSGVLRHAWNFREPALPSAGRLAELLARVGWHRLELGAGTVRLPSEGMELDFGGFGKEYAADRAASVLHECGIKHGYVNLGGDIRIVGPQADGRPWTLGVQHPRLTDSVLASLQLASGALATSGDYERYFELAGRRYCHVLDPRTGWPVEYWQSVSVAAPVCSAAGAFCTIAMLMGERGAGFIASQGTGYLAVDHAGRVHRHEIPTAVET